MEVVSVFRRPDRQLPPIVSRQIFLRSGIGIDGDCHASALSPRQVLIVSTGAYKYCKVPKASLRENILLRVDNLSLTSGTAVRIGPDAIVRITFECEPCGRLNRIRPALSKDVRGKRGYLGRVIRSGLVKPGDSCTVLEKAFQPIPDSWQERVIGIVRMIPPDCVISYGSLAHLAGVPRSFCRTFPRLLRSEPDLPWQRVVPSKHLNHSSLDSFWLGHRIFGDDAQFQEGVRS